MIAPDRKRSVFAIFVAGMGAALLTACGSPQIPAVAASPGQPQAVAVNVAPATLGSISVTTSYAAVVEAVDQVDVVPLATGRVEKLLVDVGSEIKQGQVIAELSHGALDAQLQQAQATLAAVKAAAEPNEIKAQAQFDAARAALSQLVNPPASDLRVAESAVAMARSKLDGARNKSAVATAQSEIDSAKTRLNLLFNPLASDIQAAMSAVTATRSTLDSAQIKLDQLLNPSPSDLAAGREAVADARADLSSAQLRSNQAIAKAPSVQWQTLLIARIALQANQATLEHPSLNFELTSEEIADAEEAIAANQEQITIQLRRLRSASLLVPEDRFNTGFLIPEEIRIALWDESKALYALETSRANFQEVQNPSERTAALAQNDITLAQASQDAAKERLKELQSPSQSAIYLAENNVAIAEATLAAAVVRARYNVSAAQAALDSASAQLNQLKTPRPAELAAAKTAVAVAKQTLALNQESYTRHELQAARAKVDQIGQQLAETLVLAPFDGVVTQRWLSLGAIASPRPKTPIVTVASRDVVVSLRVEETEVASFQEGQRVQFTSPGLSAKHLELRVYRVAPAGEQKAHTFLVQMRPVGAVPDLKPGSSGEVSISIRHDNVVVAPRAALLRREGRSAVFVVLAGEARLRIIDLGLLDDHNMEILNGVEPSDQIVVAGQHLLQEGAPVTLNRFP